ncbi:MAG: DUF4325 domain-containing protein [bacterium]
MDFKGVREIGQGFADEIFRVFAKRFPGVMIEMTNANKTVSAMINFVKNKG